MVKQSVKELLVALRKCVTKRSIIDSTVTESDTISLY